MGLCRRHFLKYGVSFGAAFSSIAMAFGKKDGERKKNFEVPEGNATRTLKLAAKQGGVDIVFSAKVVKGFKTRAVIGFYAPSEAFKLMLRDLPFVAVIHPKSGVYIIERTGSASVRNVSSFPPDNKGIAPHLL